MSRVLHLATYGSALGFALAAGTFFAFSSLVMPALARLPTRDGIGAMQAINVAAIDRVFLGVVFGAAVLAVVVAVASVARGTDTVALLRLAGAAVYAVGTLGVTMVRNVPLNDGLAAIGVDGDSSARFWARYLLEWTRWNHLRGAAALVATTLLIVAIAASKPAAAGSEP